MCEAAEVRQRWQVGGVGTSLVLRMSRGCALLWGASCQPPGPLYFFSPITFSTLALFQSTQTAPWLSCFSL